MPQRSRCPRGKWFWVPDGVDVNIGQVPLDDLDEHVEVYVEEADHEPQKQNSSIWKVQKTNITKEQKKKEKAHGQRTAAKQKPISSANKGHSNGSHDKRPNSSSKDGYEPTIDYPYDFCKEKGTCGDPGEGHWKDSEGGDQWLDNNHQMQTKTGEGYHGDAWWSDYVTQRQTSYDQTVQAPWCDQWWENYEGQTWTEMETGDQGDAWLDYMCENTAYGPSWWYQNDDQWWQDEYAEQTGFANNNQPKETKTDAGFVQGMTQSKTSDDQTMQAAVPDGPLLQDKSTRNLFDVETGEHFIFFHDALIGGNMAIGKLDSSDGQYNLQRQPQMVPARRGRSVPPPKAYATSAKSKAQPTQGRSS